MSIKEFNLPDLGEGLTEGEILKWLVAVGDTVVLNQPIVEVETAKAAVEIPAKWAGRVETIFHPEGDTVQVGAPIIAIDTDPQAGGGQEKNVRSGTVNVPGVIGFAAALQLRASEMAEEAERLTALRNELWDGLVRAMEGVSVHGPRALRLPGNLNVGFERIEAESLILAMRRFSLSTGSACSSGERGPSRLLAAIGVSDERGQGSVRIGLGKSNTADHVAMLIDDLRRAVARLREISAA